jgi:hypothetical protein
MYVQRVVTAFLGAAFLLGATAGCGGTPGTPKPKGAPTAGRGHGHRPSPGSSAQRAKKAAHPRHHKGKGAHPAGRPKGRRMPRVTVPGAMGGRPGTPAPAIPLPALASLRGANPSLRYDHRLSTFIPGMGYHLGPPGPGLVIMVNRQRQLTAVEASFPQRLGYRPWFDPPTRVPNAGVAFYSQHIYLVPPRSITRAMSPNVASALGSWSQLVSVNPRLTGYTRLPVTYQGMAVYGPPRGPGIWVLVAGTSPGTAGRPRAGRTSPRMAPAGAMATPATGATGRTVPGRMTGAATTSPATSPASTASTGRVAGFLVEEPAAWGWFPWYAQSQGSPVASRLFGQAYDSVLLLPGATSSSASGR